MGFPNKGNGFVDVKAIRFESQPIEIQKEGAAMQDEALKKSCCKEKEKLCVYV